MTWETILYIIDLRAENEAPITVHALLGLLNIHNNYFIQLSSWQQTGYTTESSQNNEDKSLVPLTQHSQTIFK